MNLVVFHVVWCAQLLEVCWTWEKHGKRGSYKMALRRKVIHNNTSGIFNNPIQLICMVCVTICTWCFHFKYIWRNCSRSQPQMRRCWNMLLGGTWEPVSSWELHLRAASVVTVLWGFWPERWITFLPSGGDVGYLHSQVNNFHPHGTLLF